MILTPKQNEANTLLAGPAKHILLDGGSRSGKSALIVRAIVTRALKAPKSRHAILRFHFKDAKESIGMDTLPIIFERCFPQVPYNLDKSTWVVTLPNGSEIWLGGLDDKDRTEKVLGKEYASIYLNECSQISWSARELATTRLAQVCPYTLEGEKRELSRKMYYDCNPPSKSHWSYQVFYQRRDPQTKNPVSDPENYTKLTMNPRDNPNLPADYIAELAAKSGRMRRRFLEGLYGDVAPGALWSEELIDTHRITDGTVPDLQRIIVSIDPSGADDDENTNNDDIGIMVGGVGLDGRGYLLEDLTEKCGPAQWGRIATTAFDRHDADLIVGEKNFGGAMVGYVIDTQPKGANGRKRPFKLITASRGKAVRAEPISALHEQGKIRLVGYFPELEDELCAMTTHGYAGERSPNRADAFVWLMSELFPGLVKEEKEKKAVSRTRAPRENGWMAA